MLNQYESYDTSHWRLVLFWELFWSKNRMWRDESQIIFYLIWKCISGEKIHFKAIVNQKLRLLFDKINQCLSTQKLWIFNRWEPELFNVCSAFLLQHIYSLKKKFRSVRTKSIFIDIILLCILLCILLFICVISKILISSSQALKLCQFETMTQQCIVLSY